MPYITLHVITYKHTYMHTHIYIHKYEEEYKHKWKTHANKRTNIHIHNIHKPTYCHVHVHRMTLRHISQHHSKSHCLHCIHTKHNIHHDTTKQNIQTHKHAYITYHTHRHIAYAFCPRFQDISTGRHTKLQCTVGYSPFSLSLSRVRFLSGKLPILLPFSLAYLFRLSSLSSFSRFSLSSFFPSFSICYFFFPFFLPLLSSFLPFWVRFFRSSKLFPPITVQYFLIPMPGVYCGPKYQGRKIGFACGAMNWRSRYKLRSYLARNVEISPTEVCLFRQVSSNFGLNKRRTGSPGGIDWGTHI